MIQKVGVSKRSTPSRVRAHFFHDQVGLLPAANHQQVPFAYKMYKNTSQHGWKQSSAFKKAFSIDVDVEFVGVWDTVCSVGLISRRLPFVSSNKCIRYFRHAVSLDERRAKFKANLYNRPTQAELDLGLRPGEMPKSKPKGFDKIAQTFKKVVKETTAEIVEVLDKGQREELEQAKYEEGFDLHNQDNTETDVDEVWFAGCHCGECLLRRVWIPSAQANLLDVGGGSVSNEERHSLARIPLRWMIRECFRTQTGIRFHSSLLPNVGLNPDSLYPEVRERPAAIYAPLAATAGAPNHRRGATDGTLVNDVHTQTLSEEQEDLFDALSGKYDQLSIKKSWWLLELLPLTQRFQKDDDDWVDQMM